MAQARGEFGQLLLAETPVNANSYGADPALLGAVALPFNPPLGFSGSRNMIAPSTITGRRDTGQPALGYADSAGSCVVPVDRTAIGYWLMMLLGIPTSTWTGSARSHVFTASSVLNSWTMEKGFKDIGDYHKYKGVKANVMRLRIGGDEELVASIDLVGNGSEALSGTSIDSSPTTIPLTRFDVFDALLQEGGVTLGKATALDLAISNNLDTGVYVIGPGAYRGALPEGHLTVTGELRVLYENRSLYLHAVSGTERDLNITWQSGSFSLTFDIDELRFQQRGPAIDTPGGVFCVMPFQGFYDNGGNGTTIKTTLVNTWMAYSGNV